MQTDPTPSERKFRHDPENRRFVLEVDDAIAVLAYESVDATTLDYHRTLAPPHLRGRGIASELTGLALRHALDRHLAVIPSCPFVSAFIRRHKEYAAVLRP